MLLGTVVISPAGRAPTGVNKNCRSPPSGRNDNVQRAINLNNTTSFANSSIAADTSRSWHVKTNPTKRHKLPQIRQILQQEPHLPHNNQHLCSRTTIRQFRNRPAGCQANRPRRKVRTHQNPCVRHNAGSLALVDPIDN